MDTDSTVFSVSKVTCFIIVAFFEKAEMLGSKPTTVSYFSPFPAVSFVHCVSSDRFNSLVIANQSLDEIPISLTASFESCHGDNNLASRVQVPNSKTATVKTKK